MVIYLITNSINGKQYVGQTQVSIASRFQKHTSPSNKDIIGRVTKKYGKENLFVVQLDTATTIEELNAKEIFWIEELNTYKKGYNCDLGGGGSLGRKMSEETKKKISIANTGHPGTRNGHTNSPEHRRKCSEAMKLRVGWKHTEETKKKMSKNSPVRKQVYCFDNQITYSGSKEAAEDLELIARSIRKVCNKKMNQTGGYKFKYTDNK